MIVKKVATKKSAAPKSRALHARNLCDYIAGPGAGDAGEKVEHRGAVNMLNIDHDGQVQEMADLAEVARRCPQPVQHWIVSWRQGEQPTAPQAERAVGLFLAEMGLSEHQCIYALHRNTDNYHLHLAINRVHPHTERVVTVNCGFDIEIAHRAIARIEHEQGWQREAGGRYRVLEGGELQRAEPMVPQLQRRPTTHALDFENQTGQKSAQRIAIDDGAEVLRRAHDWDELHARLGEKGMHFERKGSGAILWVGDVAVKASTVGRDCSMSALEKRLGDFVPAHDVQVSRSRDLEPVEPAASGWKAYAAEREAHYAARTQQRELLRERHRDDREGMFGRHRQERNDTFEGDWRGKGEALNALRSMLAARQAQEKAELKEGQQRELAMERERSQRWPPFENWLRERASPELAEEWRFRDRVPAIVVGDNDDGARPRDIRAFTAEAHGWEVIYRRGDLPTETPCFVDHGREIRIHDLQRDSVLAALQLSAQKWGTIQVYGSDNYKRLTDRGAPPGDRIQSRSGRARHTKRGTQAVARRDTRLERLREAGHGPRLQFVGRAATPGTGENPRSAAENRRPAPGAIARNPTAARP